VSGARRRQMAVRPPDPRQVRQRRLGIAAVGVGGLLALLLIGVFVFGGGPGATPSAMPSATATAFAGGSGSPRPSSLASPTSVLATAPTPGSTTSTVPPSDLPTPTASVGGQVPLGDATAREATFSMLGIDDLIAPEAIPRRITFNVEGKGDVAVELSDVTAGTVRMCLYQGDALVEPPEADCIVTEEGSLVRMPTVAGPWTVWLYGDHPGRSPAATVHIRWAANNALLQLADFRFQGTDSPNYTGFRVRVAPVADGELHLTAAWDDGQGGDYPYEAVLTDLDGRGEEPPLFQGEGDSAEAVRNVVAGNNYEAAIDNTQESVIDQVLLRATLTWP
jgi:hypothetical protein